MTDAVPRIIKGIVYCLLYAVTIGIVCSLFFLTPHPHDDFPILRGMIVLFASIILTKYFIYMVISPWHDWRVHFLEKIHARSIARYAPKVSVMIPAWNEACGILNTVKTVLANTYRNTEIVIINDGSTDNSDALIRDFMATYKDTYGPDAFPIIYEYKTNEGKGAALNRAIELSTGDILMSIDADCVLTKDTIANFVKYFRNPRVAAAVGNVKIGDTKTLLGVVQYLEFLFSFYFKKADSMMNTIYIIGGAAGAFRREVFEKIGVYNTKNITEDIDLSVRIQDAGMKIVYAGDAVVYTEGAGDLQGLMKQRLRWKRGRFETFLNNHQLFFSSRPTHNKILSWIILPLSYFGEMQLSLELCFLAFLYLYSFVINDFSSFISGIVVVGTMFFIQMFFDDRSTKRFSFYILMPIGWLLFYISTFVECSALFKSVAGLIRKEEIRWQKWQRKGIAINAAVLSNEKI